MNISTPERSNIILVGMPGSGKSTVGVILAKLLSRNFLDTDILIQTSEQRSLQDIIDAQGYMALRRIEERILLSLCCKAQVIATGGSAVYSQSGMEWLRTNGIVVYLKVDLSTLELRVRDITKRGLAKRPDQTFASLFQERSPLYSRYSDLTIDCIGLTHEEVCARIIDQLAFS
jgi:shikimate kinase